MTNEMSLNLNNYSIYHSISKWISFYLKGVGSFDSPKFQDQKAFLTHAGNIIINMGDEPLINGSIIHTIHFYMINIISLILGSIFHNMKHIVNSFGNTI